MLEIICNEVIEPHSMSGKIQPTLIQLTHATGLTEMGAKMMSGIKSGTQGTAEDYETAQTIILEWQEQNPIGNVEKVDYTITFADSQNISGTLEIGKRTDGSRIFHSFSHEITVNKLQFMRDDERTRAYRNFVDPSGKIFAQTKHILETYDLGLSEDVPDLSFKM